jgi:hypothetical protein
MDCSPWSQLCPDAAGSQDAPTAQGLEGNEQASDQEHDPKPNRSREPKASTDDQGQCAETPEEPSVVVDIAGEKWLHSFPFFPGLRSWSSLEHRCVRSFICVAPIFSNAAS